MTLEEQIAVLQKAQSHYEHDCRVDGMMFKFRDYIPVKIGESEYRIRKENIREIFENAKHL